MEAFRFKQFTIGHEHCGMKVGTDGVLLGAWAPSDLRPEARIADIGAGCGLLALMLAQRCPGAQITAVEVDPAACRDLRANIARSPWADRITAVESDYRDVTGQFDLVVSNPPFFTNGALAPDDARALARHAGSLSPTALMRHAPSLLAPDGRLAMIAPVELADDIMAEAAVARLNLLRRADVATSPRRGVTRILWLFGFDPEPATEIDTITVGDELYSQLTSPFYL